MSEAFNICLEINLMAKAFYSLWHMNGRAQNTLTDKTARL